MEKALLTVGLCQFLVVHSSFGPLKPLTVPTLMSPPHLLPLFDKLALLDVGEAQVADDGRDAEQCKTYGQKSF